MALCGNCPKIQIINLFINFLFLFTFLNNLFCIILEKNIQPRHDNDIRLVGYNNPVRDHGTVPVQCGIIIILIFSQPRAKIK